MATDLENARQAINEGDRAQLALSERFDRLGTGQAMTDATKIVVGTMQAYYQRAVAIALVDIAETLRDIALTQRQGGN